MPRPGQPTKLCPDKAAKLVLLLRVGNYAESACASAGVAKSTYYNWKRTGARERDARENPKYKPKAALDPFVDFIAEVEQAEATFECGAIAKIRMASGEHWTAMAWLLERKFPQRWGRRDRSAVPAIEDGSPPAITLHDLLQALDVKCLTKDERKTFLGLLRKCMKPAE
jgi:hypothetical protein